MSRRKTKEMKKILHYTAGSFAKLNNISKRNLLFYHEINLFSPDTIGENGYRYYSINQFEKLQLIIALRELKVPIEEIKIYLKNVNVDSFQNLLTQKMDSVDKQILRLQNIKKFLVAKDKQVKLQNNLDLDQISVVTLQAQHLSLIGDIKDIPEENFETLFQQLKDTGHNSIYTAELCSRSSRTTPFKHDEKTLELFLKCHNKTKATTEMPQGNYLRGFCTTGWDNINSTYEKMFDYAKTHKFDLDIYSYEEDLNEFFSDAYDKYVTQILIKINNTGGLENEV